MQPQPLIVVRDVNASSRWYQSLLDCDSGHGGPEYERLMFQGKLIMQLHCWDAHEHPYLGDKELRPYGNGVLLWFQTNEIDAAIKRAKTLKTAFLIEPRVNRTANHREFWLLDPDKYVVVIAGSYGDTGMALNA